MFEQNSYEGHINSLKEEIRALSVKCIRCSGKTGDPTCEKVELIIGRSLLTESEVIDELSIKLVEEIRKIEEVISGMQGTEGDEKVYRRTYLPVHDRRYGKKRM